LSDNASSSAPAFADNMARFVRASMKSWAWVRENSDAADIVLENDETAVQIENHQCRMMREINKLTAGDGKLDEADYERTVATLMSGGSDPVIFKAPLGAWSHAVWDAAF
jgi:NitT/TauT family transport system substrate-binding protein